MKTEPPKTRRSSEEINDLILQYISDHDGENYPVIQIARDLGLDYGYTHRKVKEYLKRNIVEKDFNRGNLESTAKPEPKPEAPAKVQSNEANFCDVVETLIWEYVKATRSTDLLAFLTWLETKK